MSLVLFTLTSDLTLFVAMYYWVQLRRQNNHLLAMKGSRWLLIGFLVLILNALLIEKATEQLIYYLFLMGLSTAASFALSFFAEENHFQRRNVILAMLCLFTATLFSSLSFIFSSF